MMMSEKPTVSIITPTYNHEQYISDCIESVLEQTFQRWEMIIVDDGSTDNTPDVVSRYQDNRIKYLRQMHKGPFKLAEAYNKALSISKGEIIAILEGDDFWPPDKLEYQLPAFEDPDVVLSHGRFKVVYNVKGEHKFKSGYIPEVFNILNNDPVGTALYGLVGGIAPVAVTVMIRKSALVKIGGFRQPDYLPFVDFPTELELSLKGKFKYIPKTLGYFRRHSASITHNLRRKKEQKSVLYSEEFITNNKQELDKLGVSLESIEHIIFNHKKLMLNGSNFIVQGKELFEMGNMKDARQEFRKVLSKDENPYAPLSFKFLAYLGLLSTYCGINLCEFATRTYWRMKSVYLNLSIQRMGEKNAL